MNSESSETPDSQLLHVQQLFVRHQQALLAFVLSIEPNLADAQDIVQEVFLVASKKAATWTSGTNYLAWICTIARYEVLNAQRNRARQTARLEADVIDLVYADVETNLEDFEQRLSILQMCVGRLSPRARELVMLRYHHGYLPEQIAAGVGWSSNAVRVALTRAKRFLRECMDQQLAMKETT